MEKTCQRIESDQLTSQVRVEYLGSVLVTQKSPVILTSTVSKNSVGKTGLVDVTES